MAFYIQSGDTTPPPDTGSLTASQVGTQAAVQLDWAEVAQLDVQGYDLYRKLPLRGHDPEKGGGAAQPGDVTATENARREALAEMNRTARRGEREQKKQGDLPDEAWISSGGLVD